MKLYLSSVKEGTKSLLGALYHLCAWIFIASLVHDLIVYSTGFGKVYWLNWLGGV